MLKLISMKHWKVMFLLMALCLSTPAFAEDEVFVPNNKPSGFRVGIDALYLRPTNSDLYFVTKLPAFVLTNDITEENLVVDPGYYWGFYAYIGYAFPCTANDLTLAYTYLHSHESTFALGETVPDPILGFVLSFPPTRIGTGPNIFSLGSKEGKSKINLNAVDLEGGQRFMAGAYDMRMFAGLRYASVNYNLNTVIFPQPSGAAIPPSDQEFNSQFKGLGPRIGVDGRYSLGRGGFGFDANVSAGLLIGHLDSYFASSVNPNVSSNFFFEAKDDSQIRMVPVLEGKLGFDYSFLFGDDDDCNASALIFEAGYQATNYFNVVDHAKVTAMQAPGIAIFYLNSQINTSDVGFNGVYVGLKYYA